MRFFKLSVLFFLPFFFMLVACDDRKEVLLKEKEDDFKPYASCLAVLGEKEEFYDAIGTVRPRTESSIEAQIAAQVVEVRVSSGSRVNKGDVLIVLDDRQAKARMEQAREALLAARAGGRQAEQAVLASKAAFEAARADYERIKNFFAQAAATQRQLEQATSAFRQAEANLALAQEGLIASEVSVRQAGEFLNEAEIAHAYTRITAPESGEVLKRLVEAGDMATPGKSLILLQTSGFLRLEAYVREGLFHKVKLGDELKVLVSSLNEELPAIVEELVPYADPKSRTFLVKAALPVKEGLYPGMFGSLRIAVEKRPAVFLPLAAVQKVGQLSMAFVEVDKRWEKRFLTLGESSGEDMVEVLSGLDGGERVALERRKAL